MAAINLISGNLLDSTDTFIVHQTNCVTTYGKGLSASIFNRFPHANVYKSRADRRVGTILITKPVVAIFGQTDERRNREKLGLCRGLQRLL
jgi:O-acetyl-ADP-ribose deacetylase (regulator of RNase III)